MFWLQRGRLPLVLTVIGDTIEADLAIRPRLHAGPIDALRQILCLAQRPDVDNTGRAACAAAVDTDANITVRHPFFRIDDLPALIFIGRIRRHVRLIGAHAIPLAFVKIRKVQPLAVWPQGHDHRILAFGNRSVDVAPQYQTIFHFDRHIPVNPHTIADFSLFTVIHGLLGVRSDLFLDWHTISVGRGCKIRTQGFRVNSQPQHHVPASIRRPSASNRWSRRWSKESATRSPTLMSAMPRPSVTAMNARSVPASK